MNHTIFEYDKVLYDRRFMSCGQRQVVVFLHRKGVAVNQLFYNAYVSSDSILQQILVERRPKFAFECGFYSTRDLAAIGVTVTEILADRFGDITEAIESGLARDGFVLLSGDVFYFPHCPEYRKAHAPHIVVLRGRHANGWWDIVDDNAASVLCEYAYAPDLVQSFFENNTDRKLRQVQFEPGLDAEAASEVIRRRFVDHLASYRDSYRLFDSMHDFVDDRFSTPSTKFTALHDAFALLSGSRFCFAQYLEDCRAPQELVRLLRDIAERAFVLKSMAFKAHVSGKFDVAKGADHCGGLASLEQAALGGLKRWAGDAPSTGGPR